ncbi:phosphatidylcholine synthase [Rhodomicrobium udaipurense JA643]|uniref:Phosphatidylcholine synthase n=1 Tax=Rhodomicrobium udaipurense TaxID=1202716 RepID=A0A8I1KKT8_9HYPH|nr:CDP-alcohol phosphatidyltransferase family protein [Rhodomicrobium udaipurense]KAI94387.1 phosphatidylcholine synthase [Rhodomicrobium udaipurense JA643]MBJ7544586.1 CDP-alcohol phosphatidyltransferase family protein [Rhodomicrobium udaipurense]
MTSRFVSTLKIWACAGVHLLTASGAVFGLFALMAASDSQWEIAFAWLGVALVVDGIDGPLARALDIKKTLPRFSGEDLDHVVDYLTYVTVPAYMVVTSPVAPEGLRLPLAALIMLSSLYHFSDKESKTAEGYFVGFPAIWNAVILYCFVLGLDQAIAAGVIAVCVVFTFIPLCWVHPVRVRRLRLLTLGVALAWGAAAISAMVHGFPGTIGERIVFVGAAVYLIAVGISGRRRSASPSDTSKLATQSGA